MSYERNIKGTWKGKERKVSKPSSPMIGVVYKGVGKFSGREEIGVLVEIFDQNNEAILRTREGILISVAKNSLKIVA
jgi:hypothetical protein